MSFRNLNLSFLLCVIIVFSACQESPANTPLKYNSITTPIISPTSDEVSFQSTLEAKAGEIQPSSTSTLIFPTPEITTTASIPTVKLCSPLQWETIPELWEVISSPYAPPPFGKEERHHGVDFSHWSRKGYASIQGEPTQSVLDGRVAAVIKNRLPYGNMVIIETSQDKILPSWIDAIGIGSGESLYILYAHFDEPPLVVLDELVACGQVIGEVGMTGYNVVNAHLHLETRLGPAGVSFGSMAFYTTSATQEEMETYQRWRIGGEFKHFDPMTLFKLYLEFANPLDSSTITTNSNKEE